MASSTESVPSEVGDRICYSRDVMLALADVPLSRRTLDLVAKDDSSGGWLKKVIKGAWEEPSKEEVVEKNSSVSLLPQRPKFHGGCSSSPQKTKSSEISLTGKDHPGKLDGRNITGEIFGALLPDSKNQLNSGPLATRNVPRDISHLRSSNTNQNQNNQNSRIYSSYNTQHSRDRDKITIERNMGNDRFIEGTRRRDEHGREENRPFERSYPGDRSNHSDLRSYHNSYNNHQEDEPEPEWMTDGPETRDEVIDLVGFEDDLRGDEPPPKVDSKTLGVTKSESLETSKEEAKLPFIVTENGVKRPMGVVISENGNEKKQQELVEPVQNIVVEDANSSVQSTGRGAGSRFRELFKPDDPSINSEPDHRHRIMPEQRQPEPEIHQRQVPVATTSAQNAFGRDLLKLLQSNQNVNYTELPASPKDLVSPPARYKTLEDVEGEYDLFQRGAQRNPQAVPGNFPFAHEEMGHPHPSGQFLRQQNQQPSFLHPSASSPALSSQRLVDMNDAGIPNDPSLHKLLGLSVAELTAMRDAGHFDNGTLLSFLQMKQKKEALMNMAALQQHTQAQGFPRGIIRSQSPGPIPHSMMSQPHPHGMPLRMPNGQIFPGRQFPSNMMAQSGNHMQPFGIHPIQQHLANQENLAFLKMNNMAGHMPMAHRGSIEEVRSQMHSANPATSSVSRPSALLPTSVMRKTVQRADSGSPLSSPDMTNQQFPGHLLAGGGDRSREREREEEIRRMHFFAQQQQQQQHALQQQQQHQQHRLAMHQHHQQQMARNPYAQHSVPVQHNNQLPRYPPLNDNLHYPSFRPTSQIREALGAGFDGHISQDIDYGHQQQH